MFAALLFQLIEIWRGFGQYVTLNHLIQNFGYHVNDGIQTGIHSASCRTSYKTANTAQKESPLVGGLLNFNGFYMSCRERGIRTVNLMY